MPTFAPPLASSSTTHHSRPLTSRVRFSANLPTRKRKHACSPKHSSEEDDGDKDKDEDEDEDDDGLGVANTNPLSLTPDEIAQYRLAGLRLDDGVPDLKGWPHRGFKPSYPLGPSHALKSKDKKGKGKAKEKSIEGEKAEDKRRIEKGPGLRIQHLNVLTTILQRTLMEGDITRATRAWGLLIRGQFGGRGVDLRESGYWGVGAELLMRRGLDSISRKAKGRKKLTYEVGSEDEDEDGAGDQGDEEGEGGREEAKWRWGSKQGLENVKDYFERLILQHPYKRHFHGSVNALDFWPAMVGCIVYGIEAERKASLNKIAKEEEVDDDDDQSNDSGGHSSEEENDVGDGGYASSQRKNERRRKKREERRWVARDTTRQEALTGAQKISVRMDELMVIPPFSDSHVLLRLRAMLALYVGDLSMPALPVALEDGEEGEDERESRSHSRKANEDREKRFLYRMRMGEYERGMKEKGREEKKARGLFDRIGRSGGSLEDVRYLGVMDGEVEYGDEG